MGGYGWAPQSQQSPLLFRFVGRNRELLALACLHDQPSLAVFHELASNRQLEESMTETVDELVSDMVEGLV